MKKIFFFLSALLFLSSCSIPVASRLMPIELESNHSVIFKDGYSIVTSTGDSTDVAVLGEDYFGSVTLTVFCLNKKGNAKNIIPTQIRMISCDGKNVYSECKVYSADAYLKQLKKDEQRLSIMNAVTTGLETASAQLETKTTTTNVNVSESGSYKTDKLTVTTTTTGNKVAEQAATANGAIRQENIHREQTDLYNQSKQELLKNNTLQVGESVIGKVMVQAKYVKYKFFKLTIPFGNEEHTFILKPDVAK